jgi:quercetin dioxygenase-like cupin family protein
MSQDDPHRLRQPPEVRFAGSHHPYDLAAIAERLRQDVTRTPTSHRQETLYKHGAITVALFVFPAGRGLATHKTKGTVIVQALKGRLRVTVAGQPNELVAGGLLVIHAGVEHDVVPHEDSEMLLTVCLESQA